MIRVGSVLYGAGREFGYRYAGPCDAMRVEAVGADWVVARQCSYAEPECDAPGLFVGDPEHLEQFRAPADHP
jgi:hypothetical protein